MQRCQEDGCSNAVSKSRPESGLCDACWQLSYDAECEDRQQEAFETDVIRAMAARSYGGLFDAMTRFTRTYRGNR